MRSATLSAIANRSASDELTLSAIASYVLPSGLSVVLALKCAIATAGEAPKAAFVNVLPDSTSVLASAPVVPA